MRKISVQKHWCTQLVWGKNVWYHRKKVVQETDVNIRYILAAGTTKPVTRFAWNGKRGQPSLFNVYDCLDVGQCIWPWKTESGMCIEHESGTNKGHDRHPNDFSLHARYPSRHKAYAESTTTPSLYALGIKWTLLQLGGNVLFVIQAPYLRETIPSKFNLHSTSMSWSTKRVASRLNSFIRLCTFSLIVNPSCRSAIEKASHTTLSYRPGRVRTMSVTTLSTEPLEHSNTGRKLARTMKDLDH